eukprot:2616563-Karenia_brevis.AAC.1
MSDTSTGISWWMKELEQQSGVDFLAAGKYSNTKNHGETRSRKATVTHVTNFFEFLAADLEAHHSASLDLMATAAAML